MDCSESFAQFHCNLTYDIIMRSIEGILFWKQFELTSQS